MGRYNIVITLKIHTATSPRQMLRAEFQWGRIEDNALTMGPMDYQTASALLSDYRYSGIYKLTLVEV